MTETQPSITCPRCRMTSHNPNDIREGYCGNCHAWTTVIRRDPLPGEIPDHDLKYLILGWLGAAVQSPAFPVKLNGVVMNSDDEGRPESFTLVTRSGLEYTVRCDFEEPS